MSTLEMAQFSPVIEKLISATKSGEIAWAQVNPTTYSWTNDSGRAILQQITKPTRVMMSGGMSRNIVKKGFLFQVLDNSATVQLVVNSIEIEETNELLKKLFEMILSGATKKGVEFLQSLMNKEIEK